MLTLSLNHLSWKALWDNVKCQRFQIYRANTGSFSFQQTNSMSTFPPSSRSRGTPVRYVGITVSGGLCLGQSVLQSFFFFFTKVCSENVRLCRSELSNVFSKINVISNADINCRCILEQHNIYLIYVWMYYVKVWTNIVTQGLLVF